MHACNRDIHIVGRTTLKWPEAIERALEESDRPLDATEIARVIRHNGWIRREVTNMDDAVTKAITNLLEKGNKLGIIIMGLNGRRRTYWLSRKGVPLAECDPQEPSWQDILSKADTVRRRGARVSRELSQTMKRSAQLRSKAAETVEKLTKTEEEPRGS